MADAIVKRATIHVAQQFYGTLNDVFYPKGWMVSIHGSTVAYNRGRDIDVIMNQFDFIISVEAVMEMLEGLGMDIMKHQTNELGWHGVVGVWHEFAVDITLIEGPFADRV